MVRKTLTAVAAAAIIGAFSLDAMAPAYAIPATGSLPTVTSSSPLVKAYVVVKKKYGHRKTVWVYRGGPRFRARRPGYGYYYGGWWYPRPYWQPGINLCIGC